MIDNVDALEMGETNVAKDPIQNAAHQSRKKSVIIIGALLCFIGVTLAVVLPLTLIKGDNNDSGSASTSSIGSVGNDQNEGDESTIEDAVSNNSNENSEKEDSVSNTIKNNGVNDSNQDNNKGSDEDAVRPESEGTILPRSFSINLPEFSSDILNGYEICDDMVSDVEQTFMYLTNVEITDSLVYWDYYHNFDDGDIAYSVPEMAFAEDMAVEMDMSDQTSSTKSESSTATSTAGQDDYGTNNQVEGVDEADIVKSDGTYVYAAYGDVLVVLDLAGEILSRTKIPDPHATAGNLTNTQSTQFIKSLLLDPVSKRITAIVTESPVYWWGHPPFFAESNGSDVDDIAEMLGTDTTRVYVYSTASLQQDQGELELYSQNELRGSFQTARSIGSKAYIVSHSHIDSWAYEQELQRWHERYSGMNKTEYANAAMDYAIANVRLYAESLVGEIIGSTTGTDGKDCKDFVKISLMQPINQENNFDTTINYNGILNGVAQVMSFDMSHDDADNTLEESATAGAVMKTPFSLSGAFLPSSYIKTYASNDLLVLAGQGWHTSSNSDDGGYEQYTYLIGFSLATGAAGAAVPLATGIVNGYLLNQFALDWYQNHLRVATTTSAKWGSQVIDGVNSYSMISMSESQVMVMALEGVEFNEVGRVEELGIDETIYAVRFMDDRGFVVTFRQTDPLYTLDLSTPNNPTMVGELKVDGFSNYLHPLQNDNYLLAIGQDADPNTGRSLGLAISVFNVTDFANPTRVQYFVIQDSYSDAQNDHLAFRFMQDKDYDTRGILMVPVSIYGSNYSREDYFDGFYFYDVNALAEAENYKDGIRVRGTVTHANSDNYNMCYGSEYLDSRSMVFKGNVMTFKGHSIMSHNLDDLREGALWTTILDDKDELERDDYCYSWFR